MLRPPQTLHVATRGDATQQLGSPSYLNPCGGIKPSHGATRGSSAGQSSAGFRWQHSALLSSWESPPLRPGTALPPGCPRGQRGSRKPLAASDVLQELEFVKRQIQGSRIQLGAAPSGSRFQE